MRQRRFLELAVVLAIVAFGGAMSFSPAHYLGDLGPLPDSGEYAVTAHRLAHFESFSLAMLGREYPSRYSFGFPALIAPAFWLPGAQLNYAFYGVFFYIMLTPVLVYLAIRCLSGVIAATVGALLVATDPLLRDLAHMIMSEPTSTALTAAALLALCQAAIRQGSRKRQLVLLTSLLVGLAMLIRPPNGLILLACVAAILTWRQRPRTTTQDVVTLLVGPLVALGMIAVFDLAVFGSPTVTGYNYWEPFRFGESGLGPPALATFALPNVTRASNLSGGLPAYWFYLSSLGGAEPGGQKTVLSGSFCALAILGIATTWQRGDAGFRTFRVFGTVLVASFLALYSVYYFATTRFLAPTIPVFGVLAGLSAEAAFQQGLDLVRRFGQRSDRGLLRIGGMLAIALTAWAMVSASAGAWDGLRNTWFYQRFVLRVEVPEAHAGLLRSASLYRATVPTGSLIVSDLFLPVLADEHIEDRVTILPLTRRGHVGEAYLESKVLSQVKSAADDPEVMTQAINAGQQVFSDGLTVARVFEQSSGPTRPWAALSGYRIERVAEGPTADIWRWLPPASADSGPPQGHVVVPSDIQGQSGNR